MAKKINNPKLIASFDENYPLYSSSVSAGFPSPAEDHIDEELDLHGFLVKNKASTFLVRVKGNSMEGAGINDGDVLIVDRSLDPLPGRVVIAAVDGELTVKRLQKEKKGWLLVAENNEYKPIPLQDTDTVVWGVVTFVIHSVAQKI